ncbi:ABC transporter ATP-binding protein [Solimonas soli]|uniref:ABC transporter ATP-binding protein n=1 Tax=Solimonas soli TaxID=413479 RepID=UPI00047FCFC8|nr:ABC transporter ATP-binding protein [Solimonas soli]
MSAIRVRKVWVEYGAQIVLEKLHLDIAAGDFVAIVGPSGCGKTTFLRLLLGQERPTRGALLLDGEAMPNEPDADRGIVFQRYSVFPHLTVLGNVLLGSELQGAPLLARLFGARRRERIAAARALLEEVGLGEHLHKYPSQLSGGMQQRLALAQALITRPKVLLLDEPFGALDPGIRAEIHVVLKRLWKETGVTIVMVTHDLREAFSLATRVVVFDRYRKRKEERTRYGATITQNIEVRKRDTGASLDAQNQLGRDDPATGERLGRDDLASAQQ